MIQLKILKTPIKEVIDLYSRTQQDIGVKIKTIKKTYPKIDENKDARLVTLKLMMEAVQSNIVLMHCIKKAFKELKLWENQNLETDEEKQEFLNNRLYFISGDLREGLFLTSFMRFENFIRIIALDLNIAGERINKLSKDVIEDLNLNDDYKNLIDLFTYLRNTVHTGGFHSRNNVTVNYKQTNYEFIKNSPTTFYNDEFLEFLIKELTNLIEDITNSDKIKEKNSLPHNYSVITFEEEQS